MKVKVKWTKAYYIECPNCGEFYDLDSKEQVAEVLQDSEFACDSCPEVFSVEGVSEGEER